MESSRFPSGQLRDVKLYARALSEQDVLSLRNASTMDANGALFPIPEAVSGPATLTSGFHQLPPLAEEEDPELAAALALSLSTPVVTEPTEDTCTSMAEQRQKMLEQVMAMGFGEASAKNALEAIAWANVEAAISILL